MDVKTAGRTVELFELFARSRTPLSLTELARGLGAPASSCFNLARALEARGYLYGVAGRRLYPTRKLANIGAAITAGEPWLERFEARMLALREATQETIILGKRLGDQAIYLAVFEGPQNVRYSAQAGDLKPLHASSIGKALLAALPAPEREATVGRLALDARTAGTITDRAALLADLARAAERGLAETQGENVPDVAALATPVRLDADLYAIAVAGPMHRMLANAAAHEAALARACADIRATA